MFPLNVRLINNSRETGMDDEETTDIYHHAANNTIVNMIVRVKFAYLPLTN